jgi:hypothetical protein
MSEVNPEKGGWIRYAAPNEAAADEFIAGVEELAQATTVEADIYEDVTNGSTVRQPGLFTWAEDPDTEDHISVITWENVNAFEGGGGDSVRSRKNRATRFFNGVTRRSIANIDMDDGGYMLFAVPEGKDFPVKSLRVIRSLELLRKLKNEEIGEQKSDGTVGLKGLSSAGLEFFERYCTALFPRVDVAQATQNLDTESMDRLLARSSRRVKIWSWVGEQATGHTFIGNMAANEAGIAEDQSKLHDLEKMGYITRFPRYPSTRIHRDMNFRGVPYVKLHDDRWDVLNGLLAEHR